MTQSPRISTYEEFWRFYLREHAKPKTRLWHIAGTGAASAFLVGAIITNSFELLAAAFVGGYGPAWLAHALVEKNRPATFTYPIWSLKSDLRMVAAWISGSLDRELEKAGVPNRKKPQA